MASILSHCKETPEVIVINDNSNDGFDYRDSLSKYDCVRYFENDRSFGCAKNRDFGVSMASSDKILLLDAHMRIYDKDFDEMLESQISAKPQTIFCSRTHALTKENNEIIDNGRKACFGAYISNKKLKEFLPTWAYDSKISTDSNKIPCILGAAYAFNKAWYKHIYGLNGLSDFGYDETLLSIKSWLVGGNCELLPDWYTGHIYRKQFPYEINQAAISCNLVIMYYLFLSKRGFQHYLNEFQKAYPAFSKKVNDIFNRNRLPIETTKRFLESNRTMTFEEYWQFNSKFLTAHQKPTNIVL